MDTLEQAYLARREDGPQPPYTLEDDSYTQSIVSCPRCQFAITVTGPDTICPDCGYPEDLQPPTATVFVTVAWVDEAKTDLGQVNVYHDRHDAEDWAEEWGALIGPVDVHETYMIYPIAKERN